MAEEFNHRLLHLARQYRGLSQGAVAKAAALDQGHYSRIENGLLPEGPSEDNIQKLADVLNFPIAFFHLDDGLAGLPLSVHPMNRRKASVGVRALRQMHSELNVRLIHLRRLLRAAEMAPELPLPEIDVDEGGGPHEIARTLRRAWSIPEGPIDNLTDYCERAGILVIWASLGKGVDGVTMKVRDLPPCIFLDNSSPPDRMRASLAHELGHVIMHKIPTDSIEDEANAFASEFMVPDKQFRRQFARRGQITLEWLARQKAYWKMSMGFLLYQVGARDMVTRHQTEYAWKKMSSLGWRTREPHETDFPYEEPSVFPAIVKLHAHTLGYDVSTLAELICHPADEVPIMYGRYIGHGKPGLYAVK